MEGARVIIAFPAPVTVRVMQRGVDDADIPRGADGYYHHELAEIVVASDINPFDQAEVLIHEIIHAVWASRRMPPRTTEESVCTHLGRGLAAVMQANPHVVHALVGALNHGKPIV